MNGISVMRMSDSISLWDILLLKDEITVGDWFMLSYVIPIAIVGVIIAGVYLWASWDDIRYSVKRIFRRNRV